VCGACHHLFGTIVHLDLFLCLVRVMCKISQYRHIAVRIRRLRFPISRWISMELSLSFWETPNNNILWSGLLLLAPFSRLVSFPKYFWQLLMFFTLFRSRSLRSLADRRLSKKAYSVVLHEKNKRMPQCENSVVFSRTEAPKLFWRKVYVSRQATDISQSNLNLRPQTVVINLATSFSQSYNH